MDIGKPGKRIRVEPLKIPVPERAPVKPERNPAPKRKTTPDPARKPEKVPA